MIWIAAIIYHLVVIMAAYRIGDRGAGQGIAVFFVGVAAFQLMVLGPASFIEGGCGSYSIHASSC